MDAYKDALALDETLSFIHQTMNNDEPGFTSPHIFVIDKYDKLTKVLLSNSNVEIAQEEDIGIRTLDEVVKGFCESNLEVLLQPKYTRTVWRIKKQYHDSRGHLGTVFYPNVPIGVSIAKDALTDKSITIGQSAFAETSGLPIAAVGAYFGPFGVLAGNFVKGLFVDVMKESFRRNEDGFSYYERNSSEPKQTAEEWNKSAPMNRSSKEPVSSSGYPMGRSARFKE